MSLPKFPEKGNMPTREEAINQIISSIAMEELGLSHVINAEGEKLQYALGTLEGIPGPDAPLTVDELLKLNESVHNTLNSNMMNQFFLKEKLTKALSASVMQGPPGPSGPAGPATIDIDSVVALNPGEPPTVENVGKDNQHVELKFGIPRGATGDVGTILASYDTLAELEAAHPTGKQGDAYLVNGVLYIWDTEGKKWKSTGGNLRGPAGPQGIQGKQGTQGPQGMQGQPGIQGEQGIAGTVGTLKASYDTLAELEAAHPAGSPGDMYYVEPDVYAWDVDAGEWVNIGQLSGPQGIQGPQGPQGEQGPQGIQGEAGTVGTLKASYETLADLKKAHPTGLPGDMYYVEPNVYAWDVDAGEWVNVGQLSGPQGIQGIQGEPGQQGMQGIQGKQGMQGVRGPQGPEATSYIIIPFASTEAPKTYANNGEPSRVSLLGFGYGDRRGIGLGAADYSIQIDPSDSSFYLTKTAVGNNENKQLVFSLPFNVILKSIYITVGNWGDFDTHNGVVFPYVQLYEAGPGSNHFELIKGAFAKPKQGIGPGTNILADTMRDAYNDKLNIPLKAGTRIVIGGMMTIEGDMAAREYWLYYTGGIGMVYDPNPGN